MSSSTMVYSWVQDDEDVAIGLMRMMEVTQMTRVMEREEGDCCGNICSYGESIRLSHWGCWGYEYPKAEIVLPLMDLP